MTSMLVHGGTIYDGLGNPPVANDGIHVSEERIAAVGLTDVNLAELVQDSEVRKIDATGKWIMPGLIDGHCHLTFGHPDWGPAAPDGDTAKVELCSLRAVENSKKVLSSGVTGVSVPGGAWFADVAARDASKLGVFQGPRIFAGGRFISTYGTIADPFPTYVGDAAHGIGVITNTKDEMITEVRLQAKNGVDLIKVGDSPWGDEQMISLEELQAITDEAHRRNKCVTIHARGAGSTKIAAQAGVDWIMHADYAREDELAVVAERNIPIMPTLAALEVIALDGLAAGIPVGIVDKIKHNLDCAIKMVELTNEYGITLLCGTDTGNSPIMEYGCYHALELDLLMKYGGYKPEMAIKAATSDNALSIGLLGKTGAIAKGYLADFLVLERDPAQKFADIHEPDNLLHIVKGGRLVERCLE